MRALVSMLIGLSLVCGARAQDVPQFINYQGVLVQDDQPYSGTMQMVFSLYDVETGGAALWAETHEVEVSGGYYNVALGTATPFTAAAFAGPNRFLGIKPGSAEEMAPRIPLGSVGFALNADKLDGRSSADFLTATNDYGRVGVAIDLYEGNIRLSDKYLSAGDLYHLDAADGSPTDVVYVNNDGRVGIGTTSLSNAKVQVNGSGSFYGLRVEGASSYPLYASWDGASGGAAMCATNSGTGGDAIQAFATGTGRSAVYAEGSTGIDYGVYSSANGATWAGFFSGNVHTSGSLGVGATSPAVKLHVSGGSDVNLAGGGYVLAGDVTSANLVIDNNEIMARNNGSPAALHLQGDGGDIWFHTNLAAARRVVIDTLGQIGLGTTTPGSALDVRGGKIHYGESGGDLLIDLYGDTFGCGNALFYGNNGNLNAYVGATGSTGAYNYGYVAVYDQNGGTQAGLRVTTSGTGEVWGDTKNFRMANPDDSGTDIWYASIEGPEAAAYIRGTVRLKGGTARIDFPRHFVHVASPTGLTVSLTPLSAESKGVAVVEKSLQGVTVRELDGGTGDYEVDYLVMAVRKGYESYQVIRPSIEHSLAGVSAETP